MQNTKARLRVCSIVYLSILSLLALLALPAGCSSSPRSDVDGGADGGTVCEGECPQDMVLLPSRCVCIDKYECTNQLFTTFLNENGGNDCNGHECRLMGEPSSHILNPNELIDNGESAQVIEGTDIEENDAGVFDAADDVGGFPVGYISWYGAKEACAHWGKAICHWEDWYAACSHGGEFHFPYGGTTGGVGSREGYRSDYIENYCWTGGKLSDMEVGALEACEGAYDGIYDMAGNIQEFVRGDEEDQWGTAGGGYFSTEGDSETGAGCWFPDIPNFFLDESTNPNPSNFRGFRCCMNL